MQAILAHLGLTVDPEQSCQTVSESRLLPSHCSTLITGEREKKGRGSEGRLFIETKGYFYT